MASKYKIIYLFLTSFSALLIALIAQYGFNLAPCEFCIYQRYPHFIILFLSVISFAPLLKNYYKYIIYICLGLILINIGIAIYHVLIEQHIIMLEKACGQNSDISNLNFEDFYKQLTETEAVPCDKPAFLFLNLSMAAWHLIYMSIVLISYLILYKK